jgi:isochorismate pyruvate lyase
VTSEANSEQPVVRPEDCRNMAEVRAGVDAVDQSMVRLLRERFGYMDAAARIKPVRGAVRDEARKAQVLENVRRAAVEAGIPSDLVVRLYEQLVEGSIAYEFDKFDARTG